MTEPNPNYIPATYEVSWLRVIRTRQRGVKPSKFKRRLRYYRNKHNHPKIYEGKYRKSQTHHALVIMMAQQLLSTNDG